MYFLAVVLKDMQLNACTNDEDVALFDAATAAVNLRPTILWLLKKLKKISTQNFAVVRK